MKKKKNQKEIDLFLKTVLEKKKRKKLDNNFSKRLERKKKTNDPASKPPVL